MASLNLESLKQDPKSRDRFMGFKGNIESFSLADVFQNLAMNSQTGTLRITPEKNPHAEEKYVYFQDGAVRFLSGSSRAPLLPPEVFMARGLVTKSEFDAALTRQTETSEPLVACLINMGYANEQQAQELLIHQIEEEIYDLFGWEVASFEFNEGPPPEGLFAAEAAETGWGISIQVSHLIMEAARRVDEWERLRKVIPSQKEIFVVDLTVRKAIERGEMETDPVERRVAMLIDGARDVEDIVEDSRLFKFEVYGALAGFLQSSVIRPATLNELNFSEGECSRLDLPKRRIKILERILALGGENLRIRRELADLMAKLGQSEHACIHYSILAIAEVKDGREEGALEIYKRILAIAPSNVKIREALAALMAKRGQKRDAFMQYQELFENLRDQHLLREARDAAAHALENDPTNGKMRNALVELLLMEDKHEDAATQLEQLGDFAARARNTGLAAESYRRAMQYRKNIRPLKKKLNEVLLTKEDRLSRRRTAWISVFLVIFVLLGFAGIYYFEMQNEKKFAAARQSVADAMTRANTLKDSGDFMGAKAEIVKAGQSLTEVRNVWSPFRSINQKAESLADELKREEDKLTTSVTRAMENAVKSRVNKREEAKLAVDSSDLQGAKEKYEQLLADPNETEDDRRKDTIELERIKRDIAAYDEGLEKIRKMKDDPSKVFNDAASQARFVRQFIAKFAATPGNKALPNFPKELSLPLLITPNVDEVEVSRNGTPIGSIRANAPWQERLLYFPEWPNPTSQTFKFSKRGYTSQVEDTVAHKDPAFVEVRVNLQRQPVITTLFPAMQFDGEARLFNGMLYAGTSDGALVEIDVKTEPPLITARFDLEQPLAGVDKRVFGQIHISRQPGKPPLFVYCTKAGYCAGVIKVDGKFKRAWEKPSPRLIDASQAGMDYPPTYYDHGGKPKIVLVTGTKVVIVDAELGSSTPIPLDLPKNPVNNAPVIPTAGAGFIDKDGGLLVIPGSDSNLHVLNLSSIAAKGKTTAWVTDLHKIAAIIKTPPVVVGEKLVAAGNNGSLRFFSFTGRREAAERDAAGGISNPPLIDGQRLYFSCSGATAKEGLTVVDLVTSDFAVKSSTGKSLVHTPAIMGKRVYCVSNVPSVLYAMDSKDINVVYWQYKVDRKIACSPIVSESRVYLLTSDGGLIGFDEPR